MRNKPYGRFIKRSPCVACGATRHIDRCHSRPHGLEQKASDLKCIRRCRKRHDEKDNAPAHFAVVHNLDVQSLIEFFNHLWELKQRENRMTATCTNCETTFRHVDRNEDGSPYIEATRCAHPGCEIYLCKAGCEHLSFACDGCGLRFCEAHGLNFGGNRLCIACAAEGLELEPECECRQMDGDLSDARGCPLHDPMSPWNVRLRAVTAAQQYETREKVIA